MVKDGIPFKLLLQVGLVVLNFALRYSLAAIIGKLNHLCELADLRRSILDIKTALLEGCLQLVV